MVAALVGPNGSIRTESSGAGEAGSSNFFALRATSYFQRAAAAFLAILLRSLGVRDCARARAPAAPLRVRPDFGLTDSVISPVASLATIMAAPITSAGLRS